MTAKKVKWRKRKRQKKIIVPTAIKKKETSEIKNIWKKFASCNGWDKTILRGAKRQ